MFNKLIILLMSLLVTQSAFAITVDSIPTEELEIIQNSKNIAIEIMQAKGYEDFSVNEKSLKILDVMLDKEGSTYSEKMQNTLPQIFGSYLGEVIIQEYGGKWGKVGNDYVVQTDAGMISFPFNKVYKHIVNGSEDSIYAFYVTSGLSFENIQQLETKKTNHATCNYTD